MLEILVKFFLGSLILLVSTQFLVNYAKKISLALKISPLIIGFTIVAIGTSLPELSFSLTALIKQDVGLAMGNIVGSNIVNILFVFAVGILIGKLRVGTSKTQRNSMFLLLATALFVALQLTQVPAKISGLILISSAILITLIEYFMGVLGRKNEDKKMFAKKQKIEINSSLLVMPLFLIVGVIIGSLMAVSAIEEFSLITNISTTVIGLSLTAIVTSLPELLTTIFSQEEHQAKLTMGNILGSNIYNLLLIGGLINLFSGKNGMTIKDWVVMLFVTGLFLFILHKYSGKNIPKKYGVILLIFFIVYLVNLG